MLNTKLPFYYLFISVLIGGIGSYLVLDRSHEVASPQLEQVKADSNSDNPYKFSSLKGYDVIKPLLWVKPDSESKELAPLKAKLVDLIAEKKKAGLLSSASVYLMSFVQGDWMYVNKNDSFCMGSLLAIPLLITYLREAETDPKVLEKKIVFKHPADNTPFQTNTTSIQHGHSYTVKELLHYMIAFSDDNARQLLDKNVNPDQFSKTFSDMKIPCRNAFSQDYEITARRFSRFFMVLYNSSYLSHSSSEYAMELLGESNFKNGMVKELPSTLNVVHRYGQWGDPKMNIEELHESGVIYCDDKPYLLTIMTKGNNLQEQGEIISEISKLVYDNISR